MAYIGAEPLPGQNREVDDISSGFNGNATAFTLQVSSVNVSPESANNILISLGGIIQNPGTDYTIAASTITFTTAPAAGLGFFGLLLGAGINTATVADSTITGAKVSYPLTLAGAVTVTGKLTASTGILFGSDTADANLLDDYEEGTFTPVLEGSSSNPTVNYRNSTTSGHYTKIGNVVHIQSQIDMNSYSGGSGEWQMGGLPFTASATATASFNFNWNQNNRVSWDTDARSLGIYASANTNHIRARQLGNNLNSALQLSAFSNNQRVVFGVHGSYIAA